MKNIIITGSYNASIFLKGNQIPGIGETIIADTSYISAGGKGSNQAIAAKFQGGNVTFVCNLGKDAYGKAALELYHSAGIDETFISTDPDNPTGMAVVFIDKDGRNSIMVYPGANLSLRENDIVSAVDQFTPEEISIVGFQLENDIEEICHTIETLGEMGLPVLLDPAPAAKLPQSVLRALTYIKPNEHEAEILTGIKVTNVESAFAAARWLTDAGTENAIVTLGAKGAVIVSRDGLQKHIAAPACTAIDTTGAGDIFSGSFMAALAKGYDRLSAVAYASCAAAISVTYDGVYEATPTEEAVMKLFHEVKESLL